MIVPIKTGKSIFLLLLTFLLLAGAAQAQTPKKGWSGKARGAASDGGAGAVTGAVVGGGEGAVIGGAAGVVGGALIGRHHDKKKNPVRYQASKGKK